MAFDFPNSPTVGQTFQGYTWDGEKWSATGIGIGAVRYDLPQGLTITQQTQAQANIGVSAAGTSVQSGYLSWVSTSQIIFSPWNGNQVCINGVIYQIPSAGITAGATGVFVNGVSGQTLAASTLYFVYLFNNSGTLTIDYSTTVPATSTAAGNAGVRIKTGDDTRTLIGMVYFSTNFATATFVISWFNKKSRMASTTGGGSGSPIAPISFLTWDDEVISYHLSSRINNSAGAFMGLAPMVDGTYLNQIFYSYAPSAGAYCGASLSGAVSLTAGLHVVAQSISTNGSPTGAYQETYVTFRG